MENKWAKTFHQQKTIVLEFFYFRYRYKNNALVIAKLNLFLLKLYS